MTTQTTTNIPTHNLFGRFFHRLANPLSLVGALFIAILFIAVNRGADQVTKTKEELEYEKWLKNTETNRATLKADSLPSLTLRIVPIKVDGQVKDLFLDAKHHPDAKDRILRLLELVRESDILSFASRAITPEQPGDVTLRIESPDKKYLIRFHADEVNSNVKATLLLKLFEEYSKDRAPVAVNMNTSEIEKNNELPFDLIQSFKESSATTTDLSPQEGETK